MKEAGVLIDLDDDKPIYWHAPAGRSCVSLPDSRSLWDLIWEHRDKRLGFAHSHPGSGIPAPSHEDLTTFRAVESALGKPLAWWIASGNVLVQVALIEVAPHLDYAVAQIEQLPDWFEELQRLSHSQED